MTHIKLTRFAESHEEETVCRTLPNGGGTELVVAFAGADWQIAATLAPVSDQPKALDGRITFRVTGGTAREVAVALEWTESDWSREVFVLLPAAAYNGNRYPCRPYKYPPMVHEPEDIGPEAPILVSDVPRLSHEEGTPSRIQLLTGDLTTPAICHYNPCTGEAVILLTEQGGALGNHGLSVEESPDHSSAVLRIEAPGVRRDTLYFVLKAFHVLHRRDTAWRPPEHWTAGTRRLADRFVDTFRRFGQLGQYLDCETGDVLVGGSTAAAMAPGALALAGQYFDHPEYIEVAEALARQLDERDVRAGITTGGPGEILKCADSESAFAMLESFVVLYEVTGSAHWLDRAEAMAAQCLTWCASYDYAFPPDSPFGRLDMRGAGSVWANVQNKHSAPGIY